MDELIKKYAEVLRNAKVGDFTYEGILTDFARDVELVTLKGIREKVIAINKPYENM
jgi:hypothetical protein